MKASGDIGRKIVCLASSNILWGLIPLASFALLESYSSFVVVFLRFVSMALILFISVLLIIFIEKRFSSSPKKISLRDLGRYLISKNQAFLSLPQWAYLLILSIFGLCFLTIFYFIGLKYLGAVITSIGIMFSLVASTLINWGLGREQLSGFKQLYLFTMLGAVMILAFVSKPLNSSLNSNISGSLKFIIIFLFGAASTFFIVSGSTDKIADIEIPLIRKYPNYQIIRTLFKLSILSGFSAIFILIILIPLQFIPLPSFLTDEISLFWSQLSEVGILFQSSNIYLLIFGFTIAPYIIYYYFASTWPKNSSFDLWAGVLQLLEPIVTMIVGLVFLDEKIPVSWLLTIIFLLAIAILMKYLSETQAEIFALFFLRIPPQSRKEISKKIFQFSEVKEISSLIGEFDLLLYTQFSTSKSLNSFLHNTIQSFEGIEDYRMQIITDFVMDRSLE